MKRFLATLSAVAFAFYLAVFAYHVGLFVYCMPGVFWDLPHVLLHWSALNTAMAFGITPENGFEIVPYLIAYALIAPRLFSSQRVYIRCESTTPERGTECASPRI